METINQTNFNQLSDFSIQDIQENAEKVFDLIQIANARDRAKDGKFIPAKEVFESLRR